MNRSRGFCPKGASEYQDQLLDQMLETAVEGTVGVFDLDGCLFDTRTRQVAIVREFASQNDTFECSISMKTILSIGRLHGLCRFWDLMRSVLLSLKKPYTSFGRHYFLMVPMRDLMR